MRRNKTGVPIMQPVQYAITAQWAFERYEVIRQRLPKATFPVHPKPANNLNELQDEFDAYVFDFFGVLNVGDATIQGARERVDALRANSKQVTVLTNCCAACWYRTEICGPWICIQARRDHKRWGDARQRTAACRQQREMGCRHTACIDHRRVAALFDEGILQPRDRD